MENNNVGDHFKSLALRHYVETIIAKNKSQGVISDVSIIDLQTRAELVSYNLDTEQFAASVNKIPIALLVLHDLRSGQLQFDQTIQWTADDVRNGAGTYDQAGAPKQANIKDLLFDLLNPSGNTAVRVLVNYALGGGANVNTRFSNELGLKHTSLQILDSTHFYVGNTTAREAINNIQALLTGNDGYQLFTKNALSTNIYTDYGVRSQLAGNDYIVLGNKVGILDDIDGNNRHDVGIIYNTKTQKSYGYALLNTAHGASYNTATSQAGVSLASIGKALLRYSGDKPLTTSQNENESLPTVTSSPNHDGHRMRY